jgi:hypothetical protein
MNLSLPAATPVSSPRLLATVLSIGCLLIAIALPVGTLVYDFTQLDALIKGMNLPRPPSAADLTAFQKFGAVLLTLISPLFQSYGLLCARRCFQKFARGEYFTTEVVKALRGFAAGLFFAVIASIVVGTLLSLLFTLNATEPGGHAMSVSLDSEQVSRLLFTGILWQIAAVMMRAVSLAEENSQFV